MSLRTYSPKIYTVPAIKTCQGIADLAFWPPTNWCLSESFSIQGGIFAHLGTKCFFSHILYFEEKMPYIFDKTIKVWIDWLFKNSAKSRMFKVRIRVRVRVRGIVENSNSCCKFQFFTNYLNWIFAAETIQGRKL